VPSHTKIVEEKELFPNHNDIQAECFKMGNFQSQEYFWSSLEHRISEILWLRFSNDFSLEFSKIIQMICEPLWGESGNGNVSLIGYSSVRKWEFKSIINSVGTELTYFTWSELRLPGQQILVGGLLQRKYFASLLCFEIRNAVKSVLIVCDS